ncbi:hypothetical protein ACKYQE_14465, partial [Enterococcus faecium]
MKKLPALGVWQFLYFQKMRAITDIKILDLINYNKAEAKRTLVARYGWREYGGKHYESIFTRFFQGYILPR